MRAIIRIFHLGKHLSFGETIRTKLITFIMLVYVV